MNILFVGKYNPEYNRNKIILEGLRKLDDLTVFELPFNKKKDFITINGEILHYNNSLIKKSVSLKKNFIKF